MGSRGASSGKSSKKSIDKMSEKELQQYSLKLAKDEKKASDEMDYWLAKKVQPSHENPMGGRTPEGYFKAKKKRLDILEEKGKVDSKLADIRHKREDPKLRKEREEYVRRQEQNAKSIARAQAGSRQGRAEKKMWENFIEGFYGGDPYLMASTNGRKGRAPEDKVRYYESKAREERMAREARRKRK